MTVKTDHNPPGTLSTAEVGARIGHKPLLAPFIIQVLKVPPDYQNRRCLLWTEASFQLICDRLIQRAQELKAQFSEHARIAAESGL